jgi:hypothetical protein
MCCSATGGPTVEAAFGWTALSMFNYMVRRFALAPLQPPRPALGNSPSPHAHVSRDYAGSARTHCASCVCRLRARMPRAVMRSLMHASERRTADAAVWL